MPVDRDRALRIALLTYRGKPHVGGQGVYVRQISKALADLGHHVEVLGGPPYPILDPRVPLVELPSLDIWADPHPMRKPRLWEWKDWTDAAEHISFSTGNFSEPMAFSLRAWRHLRNRRDDFDLIHDNQTLGWGLLKLQQEGWPILETIHHPITVDRKLELEHARTPWEKFGKRRWYAFTKMQTQVGKRMPRIMCVSESSKGDISADHKIPLENIHVVPVGVDPELFLPVPGVERRPGHIVTTASADVAMKGLKFLLEAVAKLRTERHIELTIIGKRRPDSHASTVMTQLGLDDCVTFVSGVPDERIVELYSEAEIAVVPSLYEGFSLPAIEAMSCGVPLVATTGGALPEVAGISGETCFLCEPGDSEALATTMRMALDNPELSAKVGAQGRERVINQWSWRHSAEKTLEQYWAVLDEHAARKDAARGGK
ncbi:MAG: glycosyltransferase involved in cell wall biosynthesis [Candidatus Aldehydirespiratoraceae bacterium]|jgi:glycosyltransferase involved in cell wall biosynthesis